MTYSLLLAVSLCGAASSAQTSEAVPVGISTGTPVSPLAVPPSGALAEKARALYFEADTAQTALIFEAAVKVSSSDWRLWADGAVVWAESGRPDKAVVWQRRAADLNDNSETRAGVGWALLRSAEPVAADAEFARALVFDSTSAFVLLGAGRVKLALDKPQEAIDLIGRISPTAPGRALVDYYLGNAHEKLGDENAAIESYKRAVSGDNSFYEGRRILVRNYLRQRRYNEAWKHLQKLVEADPGSKFALALLNKVRPLLSLPADAASVAGGAFLFANMPAHETEVSDGKVPLLRIGIFSSQRGQPRARRSVVVRGNSRWQASDPQSGRILLTAAAGESWTLRRIPVKKNNKKSKARLEFRSSGGKVAVVPSDLVLLRGESPATSVFTLEDDRENIPRSFRGDLELALFDGRRTIRVVNIIGLEDYTHGVVSAEMPQRAPLEALKAQALVARTHALFIQTMARRHRKEGYHLCDEQHCQVYGGLRAETERTRSAVAGSRGRVAFYQGKPAHVIYSSHCGGRTQSGVDIGWGDVPYWKSTPDSDTEEALPSSPLDLRRILSDWPSGFDRPSNYVYPSNARWTLAVPAQTLSENLNRKFKIGKLVSLRVLRRAPSGHVESLLIVGSKKSKTLSAEIAIRGLLGNRSLRSTFFVLNTEYRKENLVKGKKTGKTSAVLVPETFFFHGGGWGHAVGLCQSGAMGRAEAGQDYEMIVKSYFPGISIEKLDY